MTTLHGRAEMNASSDAELLDAMFQQVEPTPEGFRTEIVRGAYFMAPQTDTHWQIIHRLVRALEDRFSPKVRVMSDVRIDFPGHLNGFAPDIAKLRDGAGTDGAGRLRHEDVEFIAEVISESTAANDYGPKKAAYATAEVPAYLIVDPYAQKWRLFTLPRDGEYRDELTGKFGEPVDLTGTPVDLVLATDEFPVD
ncbi:Uma2 family endonuclease [Streptomyces sp. NPDC057638]|uniref:Uma2 family endonuclease n=1 Tax=Streptomyces sp. NPDC057638 TaxID=3346190 RepID=UPI003692FF8E